MRQNFRPMAFALCAALLGSVTFAQAQFQRPDHPYHELATITPEGHLPTMVGRGANPQGLLQHVVQISCSGANGDVILAAFPVAPDFLLWGPKKAKGQQKAHTPLYAYVDVLSETPTVYGTSAGVVGCAAGWMLRDKDKDLDYDGGSDVLSAWIRCNADAWNDLGVSGEHLERLQDTFGESPRCKVSGVPANSAYSACFRGDTLVATETGLRPIREIAEGERVWSFNEKSGETVLQPVTKTYRHLGHGLRTVEVAGETLRTTDEHPFRVPGKGWVRADRLVSGDVVATRGGEDLRVVASRTVGTDTFYAGYGRASDPVVRPRDQRMPGVILASLPTPFADHDTPESPVVYNIEVEGTHTYFVGRSGVLVHNK